MPDDPWREGDDVTMLEVAGQVRIVKQEVVDAVGLGAQRERADG